MKTRHIGFGLLLSVFLVAGFFVRIQGTSNIPEGQFTNVDAYFYYWQANPPTPLSGGKSPPRTPLPPLLGGQKVGL